MDPNIYLIGLGGIGAAYASQAKDYGFNIPIICGPTRKERYQKAEFTVNGLRYQFDFRSEPDPEKPADLVMIAVKYNQLKEAVDQIEPFVSDKTIILSLLNGINSEGIIMERLQTTNVPDAFVNATDAQRNGHNIKYSSKGKIVFGGRSAKDREMIRRTAKILDHTGIDYEVSDDIQYLMWWKFMVNIGINHTSAILGTSFRHFQTASHAQKIAESGMREVIEIANQQSINLTEDDITKTFDLNKSLSGDNKISMLQDVEAKRPTEVEMLAGEMVRLGEKFSVPTPVNQFYYHALRHLEENY